MNVIRLTAPGGPEVLELSQKALPEPAPGQIRVRALAIGVSSADALFRSGVCTRMPPLPAVPGDVMAGTIEAVGAGVDGARVGEKVLASSGELAFSGGCYADAICIAAASVFVLPAAMSPLDAVSLPDYQLAGALLYESGAGLPRSIVVDGAAQDIGLALVQLALADGIDTIAVVSTAEQRSFVRSAGATKIVLRGPGMVDEVAALTGGCGADVLYALAGSAVTGELDLLAPRGTFVWLGIDGGEMPAAEVFGELRERLGKSLALRIYSSRALDRQGPMRRALMQRAIELMSAGRLRPPAPTLLRLADAERAHQLLEAGSTLGKLVLVP